MYFNNVDSLETLKAQYKTLAMKHHPDKGGKTEEMQAVNAEFEMLYKVWIIKTPTATKTSSSEYVHEFYTQNGWAGSNYHGYIPFKEQTKILRDGIKEMYPECKWSVSFKTYSGGGSIYVALMEAPFEVFSNPNEHDTQIYFHSFGSETRFTPDALDMLKKVDQFIKSYRYDDSDGQMDYFDTNFYYHFDIGQYDKPFKVVNRHINVKTRANHIDKKITVSDEASEAEKPQYTYTILEDTDTRDNSKIWLVKIEEKLGKEEYIKFAEFMKSLGGYWSRFKHAFLFKNKPELFA